MKIWIQSRLFLLGLLGLVMLGAAGCATTDQESTSARPWNAPQGWETGGLPSSMMEGR